MIRHTQGKKCPKKILISSPGLANQVYSVIRTYDFTVKRGKKAPDGYLKDVLIINGQFPGPLIQANWWVSTFAFTLSETDTTTYRGDTIQVTVHNRIDNPPEGTALHWHGILQKTSQYALEI
jgi:hypothetical protein